MDNNDIVNHIDDQNSGEKEVGKFKRGDFIMLGLAGIAGVALLGWRVLSRRGVDKEEKIAIVSRNGKEVTRIDLNQVKKYEQVVLEDGGIPVIIEVEPGRIRFQASECPDQICVKTGWISNQGQSAACLPAKTIITI